MYIQNSFQAKLPLSYINLPLTLISLEDWVLVIINGSDAINFLQEQFTCDIINLNKNKFTFAAHCNPNGKILSCMYVFYFNESIAYIERYSVLCEQIHILKKYAVFSKINIITDHNKLLFGIAGLNSRSELSKTFNKLPNKTKNIIHENNITILYFSLPVERFLFVIDSSIINNFFKKFKNKIAINNNKQWLSLDIAAGYPLIDKIMINKFVPQAINLHILQGISFNKGCYLGQEIIARTTYLNTNKYSLYWLIGKSNHIISANTCLELYVNTQKQRIGTVLASCVLEKNIIWIQAILINKYLSIDSKIYTQGDNPIELCINPIFYMS